MHRCESFPGAADLKQFLDEQPSDVDSESEFRNNQWDSKDRDSKDSKVVATTTCEE